MTTNDVSNCGKQLDFKLLVLLSNETDSKDFSGKRCRFESVCLITHCNGVP